MWRRALASLALSLFLAAPLRAAEDATLLADRVEIRADSVLVAEGNVEVLYQGSRLTASRIEYDREGDRLTIEGPLTLSQGPDTVILADSAELTADLREGLVRSARLVLNQQVQIAAAEMNRVSGRYTQLTKSVASSCQVCPGAPVPLWQIRAARVVHDAETRQIYFDNALLEVGGVPVFWIPRLRLPDPSVERARGFLVPQLVQSSLFGFGIKAPYFIPIGDYSDVLLTPYLAPKTRTLQFRYRRAYARGDLEISGAVSNDDLDEGNPRGYLVAEGRFTLPQKFRLTFDINAVTDTSYLSDYDFSQGDRLDYFATDRLDSSIIVSRYQRDEAIEGSIVGFRTLRASELPYEDELPTLQIEGSYEKRYFPALVGGEARVNWGLQSNRRPSNDDIVGRDVLLAAVEASWWRDWVLPAGLNPAISASLSGDVYRIRQDSTYDPIVTDVTPTVSAELRWPMSRLGAGGSVQTLEPVAQVVWTNPDGADVPNEDSTLVELDEGNLFATNRFPGANAYERGLRANLGVNWTLTNPDGWTASASLGRVFRSEDLGQFSIDSGLGGSTSDWLVAGQLRLAEGIIMTGRALFDDSFDFASAEGRISMATDRLALSSSYLWSAADEEQNRVVATSVLRVDTSYEVTDLWTARADLRYDFVATSATDGVIGVQFRNECFLADLSLSRRFASSSTVRETTDIGLKVSLLGFGGETPARRSACRG